MGSSFHVIWVVVSTSYGEIMAKSKVSIQDLYPLTPMQQGMLFHSLYQSEVDEYIAVIACRFKGEVVVEAMRSAWQGLLDQYDILRTGFLWEKVKQPLQRVLSHSKLPWCYEDWSNEAEALKESKLYERIETERRKRFDLHQAPLMRITLIKLDENHYELIWTHHHILLDGWSLPIVMRQVMMNYQTVVEGKPLSVRQHILIESILLGYYSKIKTLLKGIGNKHYSVLKIHRD